MQVGKGNNEWYLLARKGKGNKEENHTDIWCKNSQLEEVTSANVLR